MYAYRRYPINFWSGNGDRYDDVYLHGLHYASSYCLFHFVYFIYNLFGKEEIAYEGKNSIFITANIYFSSNSSNCIYNHKSF